MSHSIAYLLCLCLDLTFQHSTWDILIHFLLKTDQLFPCNMPHTFHVLSKAEKCFCSSLCSNEPRSVYTIHPKHWSQIYFTLPSKEKKVMQSRFKTQLLLYQTKYFTANWQITWVDLTSLPWQVTEQKKRLKKPKFPPQEGLINDKAGITQFMPRPLQSPGQARMATGKGHHSHL